MVETSPANDSIVNRLTNGVLKISSQIGNGLSKGVQAVQDSMLDSVEHATFTYFVDEQDPGTHLTYDRSRPDSVCSIAAVGFGLTSYPIAVERGWAARQDAATQALQVMRTLYNAPQSEAGDGTSGAHGLFYHFLDAKTGLRAGKSELSPIDTALLMAGVLCAKNYFDGSSPEEKAIRDFADKLYRRVDWNWAMNGKDRMALGWMPESGFLPFQWSGYNEGMIMLVLAMGSPTHPISKDSWSAYTSTDQVVDYAGTKYIGFAPLFGHQYSQAWIDFRSIQDEQNRKLGFDYFENSRRATMAQNYYAQQNPLRWKGYDRLNWGLTACDGPADSLAVPKDLQRRYRFQGYNARGAPDGPDDGTIAPTAALSSLPFAPDLVLPTLSNWLFNHPELMTRHGFADAFNPTAIPDKPSGWVDAETIGIDQGPIVLMMENYKSGFVWNVMKRDPYLRAGLKSAGFTGGWLEK